METVKLQVNKKIYSKFIWLLSQFNSEDLKNIEDTNTSQKYLDQQFKSLDSVDAEFLSVD